MVPMPVLCRTVRKCDYKGFHALSDCYGSGDRPAANGTESTFSHWCVELGSDRLVVGRLVRAFLVAMLHELCNRSSQAIFANQLETTFPGQR